MTTYSEINLIDFFKNGECKNKITKNKADHIKIYIGEHVYEISEKNNKLIIRLNEGSLVLFPSHSNSLAIEGRI